MTTQPTKTILDDLLAKRILILDGSMGALMLRKGLTEKDYRGERFKSHPCDLLNNPDILNLTSPD